MTRYVDSSAAGTLTGVIDGTNTDFVTRFDPYEPSLMSWLNDDPTECLKLPGKIRLAVIPQVGDTVKISYQSFTDGTQIPPNLTGTNLFQLRLTFRGFSGRFDLVNTDGSDNGANFYINEAIKWLDSKVDKKMIHERTGDWYSKPLTLDIDTNFWSTYHTMILVQASVLMTFRSSGNKVMKKSYEEDLIEQLSGIDMDYIEHHVRHINQMEG
jgi:hypothetical protein